MKQLFFLLFDSDHSMERSILRKKGKLSIKNLKIRWHANKNKRKQWAETR